uniref:Copper transport protein ATOX1 n=1 Tax=Plectus sambesii TaxID=2011161 RepID=A0A914V4A3_9BILA
MSEHTYTYEVGMTCEGCANAARKVLGKLGDKVSKVDIDVGAKTVKVTTTASQDEILETLKKTGKETKLIG